MLTHLTIHDYAIVDTLEIQFSPGMTVITGETGAGKSIILGALGLTLGDRADRTVVRAGSERADISASFALKGHDEAHAWLANHDLNSKDSDNSTCLLRRVVLADGGSRAYINGVPVTLGNLAELGDMLMDIHSQHEHQSLLRRATHLRLLDDFGVDARLLASLHEHFRDWQHNQHLMKDLAGQAADLDAQRQLIGYQVEELDELEPGENEFEALEQEYQRLENADSSLATLQQVLTLCQDEETYSIIQAVNQAQTLLQSLPPVGLKLDGLLEMFNTAAIQIEEAAHELQDMLDRIEINPERLGEVNSRLSDLHKVARKHKVKPEQLHRLHRDLHSQLDQLKNSSLELEQLQKKDRELRSLFNDVAGQISQQRSLAAKKLANLVNKQLGELGMDQARLEVNLAPAKGSDPLANGLESAEFRVSTNPGQPPGALIKIASGGELSRISLAIQVITARTSRTPALVFDEVDVGIGGGVAKVVGRLLRELATHTQILCVTHQAQVAGQGHQHLVVSKQSDGKSTRTVISSLDREQSVREIARMLGGEDFTEESLAHAEQMVASR